MKLTTQMVALILGTVIGLFGLVISLAVFAKWSDGAIVGMVTAFATVASGVILAVRNQQKTGEVLDRQDEKLDIIERQTNGLSERERQDIAERAAGQAVAEVVSALRREGMIR